MPSFSARPGRCGINSRRASFANALPFIALPLGREAPEAAAWKADGAQKPVHIPISRLRCVG